MTTRHDYAGVRPVAMGDGIGLDDVRRHAALTREELWVFYVGLGGLLGLTEMTAYLAGRGRFDHQEHNVLAQALDEWFMDDDENPVILFFGPDALPAPPPA